MSNWQELSVTDFFTHDNWEGKRQSTPVVMTANPKPISVSQLVEKVETQTSSPLVFPQHLATTVALESWHLLSVEKMFHQQNWEGIGQGLAMGSAPSPFGENALATKPIANLSQPSPAGGEIALTLPVEQFLACMSWDGVPAIGVLPELKNPNASHNDKDDHITLDDFSQLF
ncbi:MAG: hypothetical protein HC796_03545 [Synechococcaceae cyanobacterium RL_1_2]|nr:hypothetical protein [Synechococcaceae cyanobacterium RL_1_2]